jgi:hypothetical protein
VFQAAIRLRFDNRATPEVFDERDPFLSRQLCYLFHYGRLDETTHVKVAAMHFQDHRSFARNSPRIIAERGLVGRADFSKPRATGFQKFWYPETSTDLDQFTAGNNDLIFLDLPLWAPAGGTTTDFRRFGRAEMPQD